MPQVLAAADIGSNTAHLLVAEVEGDRLRRLANDSEWLSLGEVVSREGVLPADLTDRLASIVAAFSRTAQAKKADRTVFFATEAMRAASNHDQVLASIRRRTGVNVELVSPQREAELTLRGVLADSDGPSPFLVVEMGGGSMQVALCQGSGVAKDVSLPLGTGTLIARACIGQPVSPQSQADVAALVGDAVATLGPAWSTMRVVLAGGVARGIWRALHPDGDRALHLRELEHLAWDASRLTVQQIVSRYGVKQKRAQTLLPGSLAYAAVLRWAGHEFARVSEFGVREGAILEMASRG